VKHFGPERAVDVIWWACRCHYMTRVADAFQLPLEKENVFEGLFPRRRSPRRAEPAAAREWRAAMAKCERAVLLW
jgi:hypothetical protein